MNRGFKNGERVRIQTLEMIKKDIFPLKGVVVKKLSFINEDDYRVRFFDPVVEIEMVFNFKEAELSCLFLKEAEVTEKLKIGQKVKIQNLDMIHKGVKALNGVIVRVLPWKHNYDYKVEFFDPTVGVELIKSFHSDEIWTEGV